MARAPETLLFDATEQDERPSEDALDGSEASVADASNSDALEADGE
jgi:hypothetical protein